MNNMPQMKILHLGNSFKVFQVNGIKDMSMPEHVSTREAVIAVQKGSAVLKIKGEEYLLSQDQSFIIPGGVGHNLSIQEEFQALVTMAVDSEIIFVNQ